MVFPVQAFQAFQAFQALLGIQVLQPFQEVLVVAAQATNDHQEAVVDKIGQVFPLVVPMVLPVVVVHMRAEVLHPIVVVLPGSLPMVVVDLVVVLPIDVVLRCSSYHS